MAGGKVASLFGLLNGTSKRSSEPGSNPNANSSSGSNGDKSGPLPKISGTRGSFNTKGDGSVIEAQGASINSGYCSGFANARKAAVQDHDLLEECSGTDQSFNVEGGGKLIMSGAIICSGALSGDSIPQEFSQQYHANILRVVPPSHHCTKGQRTGAHGDASKSHRSELELGISNVLIIDVIHIQCFIPSI